MVNLIFVPANATPETIFSEYEPHFNYIIQTTRTSTYIATKHQDLYYHKHLTLPLQTSKENKKTLASLLNIPIKYINVINLPKSKISVDYKVFKKLYKINPQNNLIIPDSSKLIDYLEQLSSANKIITNQEIFTFFAHVYEIKCLSFYNGWNPNFYKNNKSIKLVTDTVLNKEKIIKEFLG